MMPNANLFPDVRPADARAIHRLTGHLMEADDLPTLGRELIHGARRLLPADFMLWNVWTLEMDRMLGVESNCDQYCSVLEDHGEALGAMIRHHPVIAAGHLERAMIRPQRMSDYQSTSAFLENPLYREVYRHVDSRHQIAYDAIRLEDSRIVLSWNHRRRDFNDREMQVLHLLGKQVAALARRLEERRHLRRAWGDLTVALGSSVVAEAGSPVLLGARDGRILSGLVCGETRADIAARLGWRRDTLDRHLAELRERMGYENTSQLLQALAALKPSRSELEDAPSA